ncbi:MAG TPA: GNAT family N-acetyltransferase, partial [Candidatus Binataceae bacterium]|nr:GNAT family N-acetyltransferase [Candidatus Binataceae bacterium]
MEERDLGDADRIIRLAFGTFLGVPDPATTFGDSDYAYTRWRAQPDGALAAELDERLVGSNFASNWGSFGFFGPLSVEPRLWEQKVAQQLLEPTMEVFARWRCRQAGLFTFSHSAKHVALYRKFGFWPRFLTAVMQKQIARLATPNYVRFSALPANEKDAAIAACRETADLIHEGLDLSREIRAVDNQRLGDTVILYDGSAVAAFGVCHVGARTEAGSGSCYVKFGAARPTASVEAWFARLLDACEHFASSRGAQRLTAGVNMAREQAYRMVAGRGFRTEIQ